MNSKSNIKLFEYLDARKLIADYISDLKEQTQGRVSFRSFSKQAGFKSPNYVQLIIQGKRSLSNDGIINIANVMKLNKEEKEFFTTLVQFTQADDSETKSYYFRLLTSFKQFSKAHKITKDQFEYFSKWYNVAIREFVNLKHFEMDYDLISKSLTPEVPSKEVKQSIDLLERLGFIEKTSSNKWQLTKRQIEISSDFSSTMIKNFHNEMILLSKESLKSPPEMRHVSAITMAISEEEFNEIRKRLSQFYNEIQNYLSSSTTQPDRVYQLNQQFFEIVKKYSK